MGVGLLVHLSWQVFSCNKPLEFCFSAIILGWQTQKPLTPRSGVRGRQWSFMASAWLAVIGCV